MTSVSLYTQSYSLRLSPKEEEPSLSLHQALINGEIEAVHELLRKGADPLLADDNGDMLIDLALRLGQDELALYLIDPIYLKKTPAKLSDCEDPEGFYYKCFEDAYHKGEGIEIVFYLQKLCVVYQEKENFIISAHLLTNTLAFAKRFHFQESYQNYLLKKLEYVEACYIQKFFGAKVEYQDYLKVHHQRLDEIRSHVRNQLERDIPLRQIQEELTRRFKQLLASIIQEALNLTQEKAPTLFAFIGFGSMSREEMAPYSDLEFAILIQEDSPKIRAFFQRLSRLIELKIISLGETKYDLIRSVQVGEYSLPSDSFTPHGFSMDVGGLSPLGKPGMYELIGTPQELARLQTTAWLDQGQSEVILTNALTMCCHITGNQALVSAYKKIVNDGLLSDTIGRQKKAIDLLKGHIKEFSPFLEEERVQLRAFDVKKDFYRPIQMIIGAISLYYGLSCQNTFEMLQELEKRQIFNFENIQHLQKTLSAIFTLRLRTHLFYQNEKEILYYSQGAGDLEAEGLFILKNLPNNIIIKIYRVLLPFQKLAEAFAEGNHQAFMQSSCYDVNVGHSITTSTTSNYEEAESAHVRNAVLHPNNTAALDELQRFQLELGQPQKALQTNLNLLTILKRNHSETHSSIAETLMQIGICYFKLRDNHKAITHYKQSLQIYERVDGKGSYVTAAVLGNLGDAYLNLGKTKKAIDYLQQSLEINKLHEPNQNTALALCSLGHAYYATDLPLAISYYQQSLEVLKTIYKDNIYQPLIAKTYDNLGNCFHELHELEKAADYFEKSLDIGRHLHRNKASISMLKKAQKLALLYMELQDTEKAIARTEDCIVFSKQLYGNKLNLQIALFLNQLLLLYTKVGNAEKIASCYEQIAEMDE